MTRLVFDLSTAAEAEAFVSAFFRFLEAATCQQAEAVSLSQNSDGAGDVRVVTFEDPDMAEAFSHYWLSRRKWLGIA